MKFHKIFLVADSSYYNQRNYIIYYKNHGHMEPSSCCCLGYYYKCNDIFITAKFTEFERIFLLAVMMWLHRQVQGQEISWNLSSCSCPYYNQCNDILITKPVTVMKLHQVIDHVITYLLPKILNLPDCCCSGYYYQHNIYVYYKGKLRSQNFKESSCCLLLLSVMTHLLQRQNEGHEISLNLSGRFCSSLTNRIFIKENQGHETLQNLSRFYTEMLFQLLFPTLFTHLLQRMTLVELQFNF